MGGVGSGRHIEQEPAHEAGAQLLAWARGQEQPKALLRIAAELGVEPRTVVRWITGRGEPTVTQAIRIERFTGGAVMLRSWGEPWWR